MLKLAKKNGWIEVRQKGSHHILQKDGFPVVVIPIHGNEDLKKRTCAVIIDRFRD